MQNQRGFTVIEILIVIVIAAVLMSLAAPSFVRTLRSTTVSNSLNGMMSDLRYARSESVRRGTSVVMCRSDDPEAASPSCGTAAGPDLDGDGVGDGWSSGWFIFLDLNGDGTKDANEPVLKVQGRNKDIGSINESPAGSTKFRFVSTGRLNGLASAATIKFGGVNFTSDQMRVLCINMTGQTRIAGDGTKTCS